MLARLASFFYSAALVTLPWIGVGLVRAATGRDMGAGLQPAYLLMALALICQLSHLVAHRTLRDAWRRIPLAWRLAAAAVVGAVLISGLGLWIAPVARPDGEVWGRFGKQVVQLLIMGCFTGWAALWTRGADRWRLTIVCLSAGAAFQLVYGLAQGIAFYHPSATFSWLETIFTSNPAILSGSEQLYLGDRFLNVPRLRGTAAEPLYLGNYLLLVWPWVLAAGRGARWRWPLFWALTLLLVATWSRGAWLALVGQLLVWALLNRGRGLFKVSVRTGAGRRWFYPAGGLIVVVLLVGWICDWQCLVLPVQRLAQSFSTHDWSNLTRLYSMQAAWRAFLISPVIGVGWGQYAFHFPLLVDPMGLQSQFAWPVVNNYPLAILCETGLVGFGVLLGCVWKGCRGMVSVLKRVPAGDFPGERQHTAAACVAVVGISLQLLTFSQWNLPHIWIAWGLALGAWREAEIMEVATATSDGVPVRERGA